MTRLPVRPTTVRGGLVLSMVAVVMLSGTGVAAEDPAPGGSVCRRVKTKPGHASESRQAAAAKRGRKEGALTIHEVSVSVSRAGGGAAGRSIFADGLVTGSHLSGNRRSPHVFENHGQASSACVAAIWKAAAEVVRNTSRPPASAPSGGKTELAIRLARKSVSVAWPFGQSPADPHVARLWALLGALPVGGW